MPGACMHTNGLKLRRLPGRPGCEGRHFAIRFIQRLRQGAFVRQDAQRADLNTAAQLAQGHAALLGQGNQQRAN
ncbi:MAG: hypothetical protein BWX84_01941 [Verrucomicrobia bacterium ADurb.Bin118]|nr:MAG: hypothetical protein BWX84_01941 [Verrucomicrobia bacterium ADurb.Bin118]